MVNLRFGTETFLDLFQFLFRKGTCESGEVLTKHVGGSSYEMVRTHRLLGFI